MEPFVNKETFNDEVQIDADMVVPEVIPTSIIEDLDTSPLAENAADAAVTLDLFSFDPEKYSFCKEKSIVNALKVGESGTLEFKLHLKNGMFCIAIWPADSDEDYENLLEEMDCVLPENTEWSNRRPEVGDFVFGKRFDQDWIRGYVISVLPHLKMAMIDEAKVVVVYNLATVEKPLTDMYAYSGLCQLSDPTYRFMIGTVAQYKVLGRTANGQPDEFDILLITKDFEMKATVKPWVPMPQQLGVPCTEVPNGSEVCITGYRNHVYMYVRPLDPIGLARYNFIMETVAKCAARSPFLKDPDVADSTLALSLDGNYYRAYIMRVEDDRVQVLYHDLGRREYVDKKSLKVYPEYLQQLGYCIAKISLRDIPGNIAPYMPIIKILDNLIENKVPLTCWYDGLPHAEGVYLKHPDGETLNNMMLKILEPLVEEDPSERSEKIEK